MCPNTNCKQVATRADMDKHMETCAFSPTTCGWCSKSIPKCEIEVGSILYTPDFPVHKCVFGEGSNRDIVKCTCRFNMSWEQSTLLVRSIEDGYCALNMVVMPN